MYTINDETSHSVNTSNDDTSHNVHCNETIYSVHNDEISSSENLFEKSRDHSLPHSFVEMTVNPVNKLEPLNSRSPVQVRVLKE